MTEASVRPDPLQQVASFADPLTRMLLASDGFTTPVLEALLGTRLQVRVLRQDLVPAADIPAGVTALLRPDRGGDVLVRHSCLVDPDLSPVSLNQVFAIDPATDSRSRRDIMSLSTPIGYSLLGKGVSQRRQIVHVGRSTWRHGDVSEPCAVKAYVMLIDDEPWCYIRECYNPRYVPMGSPRSDEKAAVLTSPSTDQRPQAAVPPPLVTPAECRTLTAELAGSVTGAAAVLHLDDVVDAESGSARIQTSRALLTLGAATLAFGTARPVVAIARTSGDYFRTAAMLNSLRADPSPSAAAIEEITTKACRARRHGRHDLHCEIGHLLTAALSAPAGSRCLHTMIPSLYTSHYAPNQQYDQTEEWDGSAHLLWIGDRRRAQIRHAAQVGNPIAVRLGPASRPEDLAELCALVNPDKIPGRLTLVAGLGSARVRDLLPPLLKAASGTPVTWLCDPMGSEDIVEEVRAFFSVHRDYGTVAGGIHLATGDRLDACQILDCLTVTMHELRQQSPG